MNDGLKGFASQRLLHGAERLPYVYLSVRATQALTTDVDVMWDAGVSSDRSDRGNDSDGRHGNGDPWGMHRYFSQAGLSAKIWIPRRGRWRMSGVINRGGSSTGPMWYFRQYHHGATAATGSNNDNGGLALGRFGETAATRFVFNHEENYEEGDYWALACNFSGTVSIGWGAGTVGPFATAGEGTKCKLELMEAY